MATHKVLHDFVGQNKQMLTVKRGDFVTVLNKSSNGWCTVRGSDNQSGLVPTSYLEAIVEKTDSLVKGTQFVVIYGYTGKDTHQLTIKNGDKLSLIEQNTKDWWYMKNMATGQIGLVPASFIKMEEEQSSEPLSNEDIDEVLLSIDRAIEKIQTDASVTGNIYTSQQKNSLQTLIAHRKKVVEERSIVTSPTHKTKAKQSLQTQLEEQQRRKAPPPPATAETTTSSTVESVSVEPLDLAGVQVRDKGQVSLTRNRPKSEMYASRPAPPPPRRTDSLKPALVSPSLNKISAINEESLIENKTPSEDDARVSNEKKDFEASNEVIEDNSSEEGTTEAVSPATKKRIASYLSRAGHSLQIVEENTTEEKPIQLPSEFPPEVAAEMIDVVRNRTGLSHPKSALAVEGLLEFIKEKIPVTSPVMDGLLASLHTSQTQEKEAAEDTFEGNQDLMRLKEIFFEIQEVRDDSQQRGWAVRDDSEAIGQHLEELLQILYDADPAVSKTAIQEDKYENVLTFISYYQLEHRVQLRLLLLKVFGAFCTLDQEVISVMLQSVLPNELGHDIQVNLHETEKAVMSTVVCIMMFSTAEDVPLSVYDQWDLEYVKFLLETIENPPDSDIDDELPDVFLNALLSFNQHFEYPSTNLVMQGLKESSNPRTFSEKLMLLVNRGDDPVSITKPCCPDSLTKILLDLFADEVTSKIFYTTDLMVLIDIISRQIHDLCPGEKLRTHYLELLHRLLGSTNYTEHRHRQGEILSCLQRITGEEGKESQPDQEAVKRLWDTYPDVFGSQDSS